FADESAYQVDYTNLMILLQMAMFLLEWAFTLIMAIWNPFGAMIRQAMLRSLYQAILRSLVMRVLMSILMQQVINIGLAVAMDRLTQWMLAQQGKTTRKGSDYLVQAVGFGAVQGGLAVPMQFATAWFAKKLTDLIGSGSRKKLFNELAQSLEKRPGVNRNVTRNADDLDDNGGGGAPSPVPRPRPEGDLNPPPTTGLPTPGTGGGGPGVDRVFARDFTDSLAAFSNTFSRDGADPLFQTAGFTDAMGVLFARRFGDDLGGEAAENLGRTWARTYAENMMDPNLGPSLSRVLRESALPDAYGDDVVRAMSIGVGGLFDQKGIGAKILNFLVDGVGEGLLGYGSEVLYNGFTTKEFTGSSAGFYSAMLSERLTRALDINAEFLGSGLKNTLNDITTKLGLGAVFGASQINQLPTDTPMSSGNTTGGTNGAPGTNGTGTTGGAPGTGGRPPVTSSPNLDLDPFSSPTITPNPL
ncbi:hypothetical protein ABZV94_41615, partial [Streptomyces sp. NPDC004658]